MSGHRKQQFVLHVRVSIFEIKAELDSMGNVEIMQQKNEDQKCINLGGCERTSLSVTWILGVVDQFDTRRDEVVVDGLSSKVAVDTSAVDFSQFRLRSAFFFEFGQFRLRPISTSANFDFGQFVFGC